jgi:hypothetical protein
LRRHARFKTNSGGSSWFSCGRPNRSSVRIKRAPRLNGCPGSRKRSVLALSRPYPASGRCRRVSLGDCRKFASSSFPILGWAPVSPIKETSCKDEWDSGRYPFIWRLRCTWRNLPHDFPNWKLVNYYYRIWTEKSENEESVLDCILAKLVDIET